MNCPDCSNCEDEGHDWKHTGTAEDGTSFYKCRRCGIETEN